MGICTTRFAGYEGLTYDDRRYAVPVFGSNVTSARRRSRRNCPASLPGSVRPFLVRDGQADDSENSSMLRLLCYAGEHVPGFRRVEVAGAASEGRRKLSGLLPAAAIDVHVVWEITVMELPDLVKHRCGYDDIMASRIVVNDRELPGLLFNEVTMLPITVLKTSPEKGLKKNT